MAPVVPLYRRTAEDRRARHQVAWTKHLLLTLRTALGAWHDDDENGWLELGEVEPLRLRHATLRVWRALTAVIEGLNSTADRHVRINLFDELGTFANELHSVLLDARDAIDGERNHTH